MSADEALCVRYLLGSSTDEEKVRVEEEFFASDDTFARLREIEDELLTQYHRGQLSADVRRQVEEAYRRAPRRDRLLFHAALTQVASAIPLAEPNLSEPRQPWSAALWRWLTLEPAASRLALAAVTALLAVAVSSATWQLKQVRSSLDAAQREKESLQRASEESARKAVELERRVAATAAAAAAANASGVTPAAASAPRPLIATFFLSPGLTRGAGDTTRVVVPRAAEAVRFQLDLEAAGEYRRYRAELRSAAGDLAWGPEIARPQQTRDGRVIAVTIPAGLVAEGDYEIVLTGSATPGQFEDAARYYFTAVRP